MNKSVNVAVVMKQGQISNFSISWPILQICLGACRSSSIKEKVGRHMKLKNKT